MGPAGETEPPVIARIDGAVGRLTLNRPRALHALTTQMCRLMIEALTDWRDHPSVAAILIDHAGERGFCAGGDIRQVAQSGAADGVEAADFFRTEYRLNHLLFTYPKPSVAVMDGVVMGGGAGVALPCRYRVATERTLFAMPETGIGLFPDVGGGWYLPRLPDGAGYWLGLTGARLKGPDCLALGLATHGAAVADLDDLKRRLTGGMTPADALAGATAPAAPSVSDVAPAPTALFVRPTVGDVLAALLADGSDWARRQHAVLMTKSPLSMIVTLRHLHRSAAAADFAEVMEAEFRLASRIVREHDFQEGVRAVIVDKDNAPRWDPPSVADVGRGLVDGLFAPLPPGCEWTPLPGAAG